MEFKKDDVLADMCVIARWYHSLTLYCRHKVGAMQLLIMQHQEHWLHVVSQQLQVNGKDLATIRTWLRLPYCIGVHMDREGCTFAYLSPDANAAGQRAWLCFPLINWRDGGLLRIVRTFMELEVRRGGWFPRVSNFSPLSPFCSW